MYSKSPQISEAEWEIMNILWHEPGLSAARVVSEAQEKRNWSDGTIRTYLRRLIDKGALRYEQDESDSRIYYYYPVINENDAVEYESKSFLSRITQGRAGVVLASLINSSELSESEISELEEILKQRRGK